LDVKWYQEEEADLTEYGTFRVMGALPLCLMGIEGFKERNDPWCRKAAWI
jgi:hypothetical protein